MTKADERITIAVAMHKPYRIPNDPMYLPMHVGAALHPDVLESMQGDNTGDNISELNPYFCELTALYWLWKNNDSDYKGLVHYRRYFATTNFFRRHSRDRFKRIITEPEMKAVLQRRSVVLPRKRHYYIETIYSHYAHTMYAEQLDATREVLTQMSPKSVAHWDQLMKQRSAHLYNMMVMDKQHFNDYCSWVFPILFELTKRIDPTAYSPFHARYPGRISERLLNVWVVEHRLEFAQLHTTSAEPQNWWGKATGFLKAKFLGRRYSASF